MRNHLTFTFIVSILLFANSSGQNLILHYTFNNDVHDLSGNGNNGIIHGGVYYTNDRFGNPCSAVHFDGNSGFITVDNSKSIESPSNSFSFTCWFKLDTSSSNPDYRWLTFLCKGNVMIEDVTNPQYRVQTFQSKTQSTISINTEFTEYDKNWNLHLIQIGEWNHYSLVYDGNYVKAYLNGKKIWEYPYSKKFTANTSKLFIGRDIPGSDEFYSGSLDELRLYASALNDNEILEIYNEKQNFGTEILMTCPRTIISSNELGKCAAKIDYSLPKAISNCGNVQVKLINGLPSGSEFVVGVNYLEFEATQNELRKTCISKIIINDIEPPKIICPEDTTITIVSIENLINFKIENPKSTDNCGIVNVKTVNGPKRGPDLKVGENIITFEAIDSYNNISTCNYKINVKLTTDDINGTIACPNNIKTFNDANTCGSKIIFSQQDLTLIQNKELIQVSGLSSGSNFPVGNTSNIFELFNASPNSTECEMIVTVIDIEKPNVICQNDTIVYINDNGNNFNFHFEKPVAKDNCGIASILQIAGLKSGEPFPIGLTTNVFKVTDVNNNFALCSFNVIVIPKGNQQIIPPANIEGDTIMYQDKFTFSDSILTVVIYDDKMEDKDTVSIYFNNNLIVNREMLKLKKNGPIIKIITLNETGNNYIISKAWNNGERDINTLRIDIYEGDLRNQINFYNTYSPVVTKVIHSEIGVAGAILLNYQKAEK